MYRSVSDRHNRWAEMQTGRSYALVPPSLVSRLSGWLPWRRRQQQQQQEAQSSSHHAALRMKAAKFKKNGAHLPASKRRSCLGLCPCTPQ